MSSKDSHRFRTHVAKPEIPHGHLQDHAQQQGNKAHEASELAKITLTIRKQDLVKIKAFAEAYELDESVITEGLIHTAINEAETAMPYVKGSEVIRVEEGEEIFTDAG